MKMNSGIKKKYSPFVIFTRKRHVFAKLFVSLQLRSFFFIL